MKKKVTIIVGICASLMLPVSAFAAEGETGSTTLTTSAPGQGKVSYKAEIDKWRADVLAAKEAYKKAVDEFKATENANRATRKAALVTLNSTISKAKADFEAIKKANPASSDLANARKTMQDTVNTAKESYKNTVSALVPPTKPAKLSLPAKPTK